MPRLMPPRRTARHTAAQRGIFFAFIARFDNAEFWRKPDAGGRFESFGAWASRQSRPLAARIELEAEVARYEEKFAEGPVARPPHWSGFRLVPRRIEFWTAKPFRLHEREVFTRDESDRWIGCRLFP